MIKKYSDKRATNGGWRANAGRASKLTREYCCKQLLKTVVVKEFRHGQIRRVKKSYLYIILDLLLRKAIKEKHVPSAKLYLDLTVGKPVGSYRVTTSKPLINNPNPKLVDRLARFVPQMLEFD